MTCVSRLIRSLPTLSIRSLSMIEVEQKFVVSPTTDESLRRIGASLVKDATIHDIYYDNENFDLMLSDHWLRLRNSHWQLKFPVSKGDSSVLGTATRYHDVEDMATILPKVTALLKVELVKDSQGVEQLEQLVREGCLQPVLDFTSHRRSFTCPGGCSVDLDVTDFGFAVGEIEKMADDASQVPRALIDIEQLAAKLGVTDKVRQGKIDAYLALHNPALLAKLRKAGVLQKP